MINNDYTFSDRNAPCLLQAIMLLKKCNFPIITNSPALNIPPPWKSNDISFYRLPITKNKALLFPDQAKAIFLEYNNSLPQNSIQIYCDGSLHLKENKISAAYLIPKTKSSRSWSLMKGTSIMSAELSAMDVALNKMYHSETSEDEIFIYTDSLSSLQLLQTNPYTHPTAINIINTVLNLKSAGMKVSFVWVPSHVGIEYNEEVDKIANNEIHKPTNYIQNPLSFNEKRNIAKIKYDEIKKSEILRKLSCTNVLLPPFGPQPWFSHDKNRTASIALHRLRTGHNHLNGHRSKYKPITSLCRKGCNTREDSNHILIVCPALEQFRLKIKQLFTKYNLKFDKETVLGYSSNVTKKIQVKIRNNLISFLNATKIMKEI